MSCGGDGCRQGRWPQLCNCQNRHTWRETVRDSLIGDEPADVPTHMAGDGAESTVAVRWMLASAAVVTAVAAAAALWGR